MFSRLWTVAEGIDGSSTTTFGPRSTSPGEVLTGVTWKRWAAVPLQVYWASWTLSAAEAAGTSRHLPLLRLTKR